MMENIFVRSDAAVAVAVACQNLFVIIRDMLEYQTLLTFLNLQAWTYNIF